MKTRAPLSRESACTRGCIRDSAVALDESGQPGRLLRAFRICWGWVFVPEWQRFYARQGNSGLSIFQLSTDGLTTHFIQTATTAHLVGYHIEMNRDLRKVYYLDQNPPARLVIWELNKEGRLMSLAQYHPLGDVAGVGNTWTHKSDGGNLLFADGHVVFQKQLDPPMYNGKYPWHQGLINRTCSSNHPAG